MNRLGCLLIALLPVALFSTPLSFADPMPVCGFPHVKNKTGEVVIKRLLEKPADGDTSFFIYEDITLSSPEMIEVAFRKVREEDGVAIYAEVAEIEDNNVSSTEVSKILAALLYETPSESIDPGKGILINEIEIFGSLPNVNNDDKLMVLLTDIRDDYDADDNPVYIAGYFDPRDQISNSGKGNFGDILYIDTYPGNIDDEYSLGIVAHELQHLIHHGVDDNESTWLDEGMSEFAMFILGFGPRSSGTFLRNTNRSLTSFDNSIADYAKVGLWTRYCYSQFGMDFIKSVVQSSSNSLESYYQVLSNREPGIDLETLMRNWFVANLINNPDIDGGVFGYGEGSIADLYSDYFYGSFEGNDKIDLTVKNAAAQYIQFYAGKNIRFDMDFPVSSGFKLAIVKEGNITEVDFANLGSAPYHFSDASFGISYNKLTFIPYWANFSELPREKDISFSAHLVGGIEEIEIVNSRDLTYYIRLGGAKGAEKYTKPSGSNYRLAGVKFNVGGNSETIINIYEVLNGLPKARYEIIPSSGEWTTFYLPAAVSFPGSGNLYISVSSTDYFQSLGYSETGEGFDRAYLEVNNGFRDLSDYVDNSGSSFDGDWMIGAILHSDISVVPDIEVSPKVLEFYNNEYSRQFELRNAGGGSIDWSIASAIPDWMTLSLTEGAGLRTLQKITVSINRSSLEPGLHNRLLEIESSAGSDSILISVLERNLNFPQAGLFTGDLSFSHSVLKQSMKVFNVGINGSAVFHLFSDIGALAFSPDSGMVGINDTILIDAIIDPDNVQSTLIPFAFYNGIDTVNYAFSFPDSFGTVDDKLELFTSIPNPYIPSNGGFAQIRFRLQTDHRALLQIFNVRGELVQSMKISQPEPGLHIYAWDGNNRSGRRASSGVYLISIHQDNKVATGKMLLLN